MTEKTENVSDDAEEKEIEYEEVEMQIDQLHQNLDSIKQSGQQLAMELQSSLPDDPEQEELMRVQELAGRAGLLYDRVEKGDKSIVRGE